MTLWLLRTGTQDVPGAQDDMGIRPCITLLLPCVWEKVMACHEDVRPCGRAVKMNLVIRPRPEELLEDGK